MQLALYTIRDADTGEEDYTTDFRYAQEQFKQGKVLTCEIIRRD
jgi:hypothetical protein